MDGTVFEAPFNDGGLPVPQDLTVDEAAEVVQKYPTVNFFVVGPADEEGPNSNVDHPKHYNQHPSGIECIEIVRHMGFNLGNVVKYIWRDGHKDTEVPLQDLEKALWYLKDEIETRRSNGQTGE